MECNPKGGGGENFGAKQGSLRPRAENLGGDGGLPLARSPDVRTLPKASRQKRTGRRPYRAGGAGSTRSAATPGPQPEALDAPRTHDRARELPAGTEKPPGGSGGEPAPGAVVVNRGGASIDGLCRLGGKPTPRRYAGGPTSPARAGSGRVDRGRRRPVAHAGPPHPCLERAAVVKPPDAHGVRCRGHRHGVDAGLGAVVRWHPRTHRAEAAALDGRSDRLGRERVPRLLGRGVPVPSATTHARSVEAVADNGRVEGLP